MRRSALISLFSTSVLATPTPSDASQTADSSLDANLSCQGTSTFTDYVPLQTVTVTVDGSYTYTPSGNDTAPTAAIYYTPPPACASVVVPSSSTSDGSTVVSSSVIADQSMVATQALNVSSITYTSVYTWTETITSSNSACNPDFSGASSTVSAGPPYANSSTSTGADATASCGPHLRFGTWTTTQTFISAAPVPGSSSAASGHAPLHPQNPGTLTEVNPPPGVASSPSSSMVNAPSRVATVTITKKTPVAAHATSTAQHIVFPSVTDGTGSPNAVTPKATSKTPVANPGGGNTSPAAPKPTSTGNNNGGQADRPANSNSPNPAPPSPTGGANNPASSKNNPAGSDDGGRSAASTTKGNGIGSIINSAFNSPFTTVGLVTSYGAASATVNLVNGVPVQVESSSVYIGGSYVAIPTGSSTVLVTVAGQTFTVGSGAVVGGSSTLEIHRSEGVSSSPVQAATLKASTITQNGVVVTIQPTAAIVDGKTYSIGLNAGETKVVVDGQTITLNSNGVAFASTTYAPAMVTTSAYVVSTIGGLTFSIDSSEAIIGGTTYRIGAGAHNSLVTTEIDGTKVIFGPSGIILPSTTIAPTGVSLTDAGSAETSGPATVKAVSSPTSDIASSTNGASRLSHAPTYLSNTLYTFSILLALSTLPLGLLL